MNIVQVSVLNNITKPILLLIIFFGLLSSSCSSIGYYAKSISGQMNIFLGQKGVSRLINDSDTNELLRQKLRLVQDILEFAHEDLYLPDNGSYRRYVDTQRRYVVWNVFAAPEFSLAPKQWCYPIVGCMNYRGYFNEDDSLKYSGALIESGWEVYIGGVTAYSTLGWFRDPLLNTMLNREDWEIARLIFHELAHQLLYVKHDTDFNEAFADTVAQIGLQAWLKSRPIVDQQKIMELISHENEFINLVLLTRNNLFDLYKSGGPEEEMRINKSQIIKEFKRSLLDRRDKWGEDNRYDGWLNSNINNARLSAVSTYRLLVPHFYSVYKASGSDLSIFYSRISELSKCNKEYRIQYLMDPGEFSACLP